MARDGTLGDALSMRQGDFNVSICRKRGLVLDRARVPPATAHGTRWFPFVDGKHVKAFAVVDAGSPALSMVWAAAF
jgi:hypothetical protein